MTYFKRLPLGVRVGGSYLLFGILWITVSDLLLGKLVPTVEWYGAVQTVKGVLFVGLSAGLITVLVQREWSRRQQHEARFRALIEHAWDGITVLNPDGSRAYVSPALGRITGYPVEQLVGSGLLDFIHPEDQANMAAVFDELRQHPRTAITAEARQFHADGSLRQFEYVAINFLDEPSVRGIVINSRDITERTQALEALTQSEARFRSLIQNASDMFSVVDAAGIVQYASSSVTRLTGFHPEDFLGRNGLDWIHPDDRSRLWRFLSSRRRVPGYGGTIEARFQRRDGSWLAVETSVTNLLDDPSVGGLVLNARDITERTQSEERLQALLEQISDIIVVLAADGTVRYVSPSVRHVTGYRPEELVGHVGFAWIHPDDTARVQQFLATLEQQHDATSTVVARYRHADGTWRVLDLIGLNRLDDPSVDGILLTARDVTERKENETRIRRQLEQLAALNRIDHAILAGQGLSSILPVVLDEVMTQLGVDATDLLLLDDETHILTYAQGRGFRTPGIERSRLPLGEGVSRVLLAPGAPHLVTLSPSLSSFSHADLIVGEGFVSVIALPLVIQGQPKGVLELYQRTPLDPDPEWLDFAQMLADQTAVAIDHGRLVNHLQQQTIQLSAAYDRTLEGWSRALELRDLETRGHSERVTRLAVALAQSFGIGGDDLLHFRRGALLHDIGKMAIPDAILLKPGPLTDTEWMVMRQHPIYAYELLRPIAFLQPALDIPYGHHEQWDGSGYPRSLSGDAIPLAARIFAVVDVWDALTSDRPYRPAWSLERAEAYLQEQSGHHFDPRVVEAFLATRAASAGVP